MIRAEFEALENGEADFGQALRVLEDVLADLDGGLRASLVLWEGDAREAYQVAHDRWISAAGELRGALADLHRVLGVAHGNFRGVLTANLRMWRV